MVTNGSYTCDKHRRQNRIIELLHSTPDADVTLCICYTSIKRNVFHGKKKENKGGGYVCTVSDKSLSWRYNVKENALWHKVRLINQWNINGPMLKLLLFGNKVREKLVCSMNAAISIGKAFYKKEILICTSHYKPKLILNGNVKVKGKTIKILDDNIRYLTFEYRYLFWNQKQTACTTQKKKQ